MPKIFNQKEFGKVEILDILCSMKKFLILTFFLCVVIAKAKENKEYRFNWYPVIDIGDNIINFPDSSKYETYNSSGLGRQLWKLWNDGMQCITDDI